MRDKGSKETTWMTFFHDNRFSPFNEQHCSNRLGVEGANHDSLLAFHSIRVDPKNAMWVRELDTDQFRYVF
jgi:hypothetical protein